MKTLLPKTKLLLKDYGFPAPVSPVSLKKNPLEAAHEKRTKA
jgi:hypothetical protein